MIPRTKLKYLSCFLLLVSWKQRLLLLKPFHIQYIDFVCWHEATLSLTLITPLSTLFKETCILPVSRNSRCLPDKAPIVGAQLSVKGASPCPPAQLLSKRICVVHRPQRSHVQHRSTPALSRNNPFSTLAAKSYIPPTSCVLFIYTFDEEVGFVSLNLRCSRCVWAWRTHPPS